MFWSRSFRRRSTVVERIEACTAAPTTYVVNIPVPVTVDAMLLADQFERELKRRGY